jgi:hypothetical protein
MLPISEQTLRRRRPELCRLGLVFIARGRGSVYLAPGFASRLPSASLPQSAFQRARITGTQMGGSRRGTPAPMLSGYSGAFRALESAVRVARRERRALTCSLHPCSDQPLPADSWRNKRGRRRRALCGAGALRSSNGRDPFEKEVEEDHHEGDCHPNAPPAIAV